MGKRILRFLASSASFITTIIIIVAAAVLLLYIARIRPYVVVSGSMEPAIPLNSVCFIDQRTPFSEIKEGQVIAFRTEGILVTHRVVDITDTGLITRGDANNTRDVSPVNEDNYVGKNVFVIPKVGSAMMVLHTTAGKLIVSVVILLLAVLSFIPKKNKDHETLADNSNKPNQ